MRPGELPQATSGDFSPGGPATSSPPAIEIISGIQWPPTKGGSSHSRAITRGRLRPGDRGANGGQAPLELTAQLVRLGLDLGRLAEADHVLEHLAERARVLLQDPGLAGQPRRDLEHVLVGDRADVADRLGDDQVGGELGEQLLVELVERLALGHPRLHRAVDLGGVEARRQHGRGQMGEEPACGG